MSYPLPYGPDQLTGDGAWQTWQFSGRQFIKENRIDLSDYLLGSWENGPINNQNQTPSTFYQMMDGTAQIKGSVIWNDTATTDAIIPIFDFSSEFWRQTLLRYSWSVDTGMCSIRSLPPGTDAVVLPAFIRFTPTSPIDFALLNSATPYSFDANSAVEIHLHLVPYFGDNE